MSGNPWLERWSKLSDAQRHALDVRRNIVVRANAGSGKTTVMIERIIQWLASGSPGSVPPDPPPRLASLVAITFTRKAAMSFQERLRRELQSLADAATSAEERDYWRECREDVALAMIGTIDSFCGRILREHGYRAQVNIGFEPLDPFDEDQLKRQAFDQVVNRLNSLTKTTPDDELELAALGWWTEFEGVDVLKRHVLTLLNKMTEPATIRAAHIGLPTPEERAIDHLNSLPAYQHLMERRGAHTGVGVAETMSDELIALARRCRDSKPGKFLSELADRLDNVVRLLGSDAPEDAVAVLNLLRLALYTQEKHMPPRTGGMTKVKDLLEPLQEEWRCLERFSFDLAAEVQAHHAADMLALLVEPVHEEYLAICRETGRFDFLSIARAARDILRHSPEVRSAVKERYRFIMVDEFQDTNALQWEIIAWVAGSGPNEPLDRDRLFVVGDPQQSIYRFRKADVRVFATVSQRVDAANRQHDSHALGTIADEWIDAHSLEWVRSSAEERCGLVRLSHNFRSLSPVPLELMDRVFQHAFDPSLQNFNLDRQPFEIRYQPLVAGIAPSVEAPGETIYVCTGRGEPDEVVDEEQDDTELQVRAVVDQLAGLHGEPRWLAKADERTTLTWGDMAILLPSRKDTLGKLETELRRRGIPFVVHGGIGFWQRQEIRDIVNLATALANPSAEIALFGVLRGPIGQLEDTQICWLTQYRDTLREALEALGESPTPNFAGRPRGAIEAWQEFSDDDRRQILQTAKHWHGWRARVDRMAHADLLQRALEESGALTLYAIEAESALIDANLRQLFEIVRLDEYRSAAMLTRVARRMREQVEDVLDADQADLAADEDAIQIMTVHAAKGLEFPVVAVMKMHRKLTRPSADPLLLFDEWDQLGADDAEEFPDLRPGTLSVSIRHPQRPRELFSSRRLRAFRQLENAQHVAESRRLFYVAGTRAQERLILAGKHFKHGPPPSWQKWFEDALLIQESHMDAGAWTSDDGRLKVRIVVKPQAQPLVISRAELADLPALDLEYIHETPAVPAIATTSLEPALHEFAVAPEHWWFQLRKHLRPVGKRNVELAANVYTGTGALRGKTVGTMIHRLLEMPDAWTTLADSELGEFLAAMAQCLLAENAPDDVTETNEVAQRELIASIVADADAILAGIRGTSETSSPIRSLALAPGVAEVPFACRLGGWHISGRFDKLATAVDGYAVIDWKTDSDADLAPIVARHEPQMKLYALALWRSGKASLQNECVLVHLVALRLGIVHDFHFSLETLMSFEAELTRTLAAMNNYSPFAAKSGWHAHGFAGACAKGECTS